MNKYVAIYRVPLITMEEWKKNTNKDEMEEQSKTMMSEMNAWMDKHEEDFLNRGEPLGKNKSVSQAGIMDSRNDLNYMQIVQAESHEAAARIFEDCPHLKIPNSFIDVMEVPHMGL